MGLCMFTFSSCDDEKESTGKPIVGLNEVGKENSKTGIAGSDLHLEGEIIAENLIRRIDIEIHQEDGGDFKIEKSFTEGKYIGVKNAHFHEHIEIPSEAPAGKYHLHFTVTDRLGQTETRESELTVKAAAAHIIVEDLKFGASHDFSDNKIDPKTFFGLAGVGDLIATCGSPLSRNYTFGSNLGKGLSVEEATKVSNGVAEGVPTTDAVVALGNQLDVPTPLAYQMSRVLNEGISCAEMLAGLFGREITVE